ncbi:MAG TPA: MFS transporter [Candidatus Dormibacteraeota bacterium]
MKHLWGNRNARLYLTGSVVSTFGDRVLFLAAGIWVRVLTGSNAEAGLTFFFMVVPQVVASPLAGVIADRFRRRSVMVVFNFAGAAVVLLLLLVRGPGDVWLIWLVMAIYGAIGTVTSAAGTALLVTVVPGEELGQANGFLQTVAEGMRLVTPLVGAGLFAAFGAAPVVDLDAATFIAAAGLVWAMRVHEALPARTEEHWLVETTAGFQHVWRTIELRQILLGLLMVLTVVGFLETAAFAVVTNGLHRPASFVGVIISIQGIGAVAGGLTAATVMRRLGETRLTALGIVGIAVGSIFLVAPALMSGVLPGLLVGLGAVILGFGLPWTLVGAITLVQRRTPLRLQGRVDAAFGVLFGAIQSISIALGAILVGVLGYVAPILSVVVVCGLGAAYLYTRPVPPLTDDDQAEPLPGTALPGELPPSLGQLDVAPGGRSASLPGSKG